MNRYRVDKLLYRLLTDAELEALYARDRAAAVDGAGLEPHEAEAIVAADYASLYTAGVHPFLLWQWAGRIGPDERDRYLGEVAGKGYPSYAS
jgi:hypothetical protein